MNRLYPSRVIPWLAAASAAGIIAAVDYFCCIGVLPKALPAATMTFGVVVAGFTATHRAMLLTMNRRSRVIEFAVRTGYYKDVLAFLMHPIIGGMTVSIVSLAGFFIQPHQAVAGSVWLVIWVFVIVLVIAWVIRNEILMGRVAKRYMESPPTR